MLWLVSITPKTMLVASVCFHPAAKALKATRPPQRPHFPPPPHRAPLPASPAAQHGNTPLILAAGSGHECCVKALLGAGCDKDKPNNVRRPRALPASPNWLALLPWLRAQQWVTLPLGAWAGCRGSQSVFEKTASD